MLAQIEAQRAYFASDDHIRERAAMWRDATPEERFAAVIEQCREAEHFLALKDDGELARVLADEPLPDDTRTILENLQRKR